MSPTPLEQLVEAVLYEGHILYPYRPSARKNRQRFTFGRVYPEAGSVRSSGTESSVMQAQCLFVPRETACEADIVVRFLQPANREIGVLREPVAAWPMEGEPAFDLVPVFDCEGALYQSWQEAIERELRGVLHSGADAQCTPFSFAAARTLEPIRNAAGAVVAVVVRNRFELAGTLELSSQAIEAKTGRLTVRLVNHSPLTSVDAANPEAVLLRTFASAHAVIAIRGADLISLTDPPAEYAAAAAQCQNVGVWPVLVGDEAAQERHTLLASPIILPDYPRIAPQSPGTLFDGGEIDEILSLRILTLTDEEKREMREADPRTRHLLERTEELSGEQWRGLHGGMSPDFPIAAEIFGGNSRLEVANLGHVLVRAGDRVRIRPKSRADIMDLVLAGKIAIIDAVEQDAEGRVHLALLIEDDPGRDLGAQRKPGHRFFYGVDEVEPLGPEATG